MKRHYLLGLDMKRYADDDQNFIKKEPRLPPCLSTSPQSAFSARPKKISSNEQAWINFLKNVNNCMEIKK